MKKLLLTGIAALFLATGAYAETQSEWLAIVSYANQNIELLDKQDRFFVRYMANIMFATDAIVMPTPPQQQWLRAIKAQIDAWRRIRP
jgi:hypothetical protein